jgi:endonuclease/exonuclease/phosphatase family metal-dependent hydrolase
MMLTRWILALLGASGLLSACRTGRNYPDASGPRFAGAPDADHAPSRDSVGTLRIVSFNIAFAKHVAGAIELLQSEPALRDADVMLLQEMDGESTGRVARALGLWYVYYPAIFHNRTKRDFGNAVLSRWPITGDAKLVLPHVSRYAGTQRIATVATILVGDTPLRVYSTHLSTIADGGAGVRRDQLRAIVEDAAASPRVIIGGDLNTADVSWVAREHGYAWPSEEGPHTTRFGRWDHIFLKGLTVADSAGAGTVLDARGTSDHRPIWARVQLFADPSREP